MTFQKIPECFVFKPNFATRQPGKDQHMLVILCNEKWMSLLKIENAIGLLVTSIVRYGKAMYEQKCTH